MNTQAVMIDKNAFEEKELWASFLNFSNNVLADIQSYPENKLAECEFLGFYPALEFIIQGLSEEYDFYNLPINGFYENSQGTIFDYGKKKIKATVHLDKNTVVLSYFTLIQDHQNSKNLNEQINYIILKEVEKNGEKYLAFTSARNFLEKHNGQTYCSWDYLGEIVYLNLPLFSLGDENSIQITNWRSKIDTHHVIRTTDENIAEITIIVAQILNKIQNHQFKKMTGYFETRD